MANSSKKSFCRCCLVSAGPNGPNFLNMNENFFLSNNQKISLAKSYLEVTGCFVAGKLSRLSMDVTKICELCAVKLQAAYTFRDLSIEANAILEMQYESEKQSSDKAVLIEPETATDVTKAPTVKKVIKRKIRMEKTVVETDNFLCPCCPKTYTSKSSLKAHVLFKHENSENYKFKCKICSKRCPTNFILKAHYDTHTAEPTHECHICRNSFKHRTYLLQHLKKHSTVMSLSYDDLKESQKLIDSAKKKAADTEDPYIISDSTSSDVN